MSAYTLLIVESPVLARLLQLKSPPNVFVMPTNGFCWTPVYEPKSNKLLSKADPKMRSIRKELKEQASISSKIVIATDNDSSGDFIAWSIARYLNHLQLYRTFISHPGKAGIEEMLDTSKPFDMDHLEYKLKNKFMIWHQWHSVFPDTGLKEAALAVLFGQKQAYSSFMSDQGVLFRTLEPTPASSDDLIVVSKTDSKEAMIQASPLSTFSLLPKAVSSRLTSGYKEAQELLTRLFQYSFHETGEGLISYPRTGAQSFYSETWSALRNQFTLTEHLEHFKPTFLQEVCAPDEAHESIHPLNINLTPEDLSGWMPANLLSMYRLIFEQTQKAIRMPQTSNHCFESNFHYDIIFYPNQHVEQFKQVLTPVLTAGEIGRELYKMQIIKPSSFGKDVDYWLSNDWLREELNIMKPGRQLLPLIEKSGYFSQILKPISGWINKVSLEPETVRQVFTS